MIDTTEIGAGSYPEPPEPKDKCYQFDFTATIRGYGYVYAENVDRAKELINNNDYDDIVDTWDLKIEEVNRIEEE